MTSEQGESGPPPTVVFMNPDVPIASVIVLAWRLGNELVDCLRSLKKSDIGQAFEVIVVLNGANEIARAAVAENVRGANIVDLDANVGYGGGCNAGALRARGKYLVLLNDDTLVDSAWLSSLVSAAEKSPTGTGALSSLLLNPDGTVQEAGCRVLSGAGTVQFAKGMTLREAKTARLLSPREIDYGSGAALLVRRDAFESIGGFDPLYEPAYYEDVDLCFRLRRAGYSVRFVPKAHVTHASGGSTLSDRRFRDFAASRSGSNFIARWANVLAHAPEAMAAPRKLCDPTLVDVLDPPAPREISNPTPSAAIALAIADDYQRWLNQQIDIAEERVIVEHHFRSSDAKRIDFLREEARSATDRLSALERDGLVGMVRWRVVLMVRRHRAKKALGNIQDITATRPGR